MSVTGAAALWRWDAIFLDRRDHANLVPLPVSLRTLFLANFSAILVPHHSVNRWWSTRLPSCCFPWRLWAARARSEGTACLLQGMALRCWRQALSVFLAVFALAGCLLVVLPTSAFSASVAVRAFRVAVILLGLLASVFTVPATLLRTPVVRAHVIALLPPVSFLGLRGLYGGVRR